MGTDRSRDPPQYSSVYLDTGIEVRFQTCVVDLLVDDGHCKGVIIQNEDGEKETINCDYVIMAAGHSARDLGRCYVLEQKLK